MSYILEALKKSDKERQKDEIPDLQSDHSPPPLRRKKRQSFSWNFPGAVVLVLLCAGGLLWWQLGVDKEKQPRESVIPVTTPAPPLAQELQLPEERIVPEQSVMPRSETNDMAVEKVDSAVVSNTKLPYPAAETVIDKKSIPVKKEEVPASETEFVPPLMDELPVAVRAAIPTLSFAGHVYSEAPQKRLIIINNRVVREGDLIVNSLFLEEIDREGVVLRYDTSIFRVKLF